MANTYAIIASSTVGSGGASSIDFTSIPQTFKDLILVWSGRGSTNYDVVISFNSSSSSFGGIRLYGDGTSPYTDSMARFVGFNSSNAMTASAFGNNSIYIPNYTDSTNKLFSVDGANETAGTTAYATLATGTWSNTAAITSISLSPSNGTFNQYSTAYLYGIKNS